MTDTQTNLEAIIPVEEWQWFGNAAHFICGRWCRFHMATKVGGYLISTVGELVPSESLQTMYADSRGKPLTERGDAREAEFLKKFGFEKLGASGLYETMVFDAGSPCDVKGCGCGLPRPRSYVELAGMRYDTAKEATIGHREFCDSVARGQIGREDVIDADRTTKAVAGNLARSMSAMQNREAR